MYSSFTMGHDAQDLALMEFADLAEGNTAQHVARRADVFADETGRLGWTPLAGFLVEELREFVGTLGAALSAMAGVLQGYVWVPMWVWALGCDCVLVRY